MLGFNTGYVEELYRQFLENPQSVSESWQEFFSDYQPTESFQAAAEARRNSIAASTEAVVEAPVLDRGDGSVSEAEAPKPPPEPDGRERKPLRGAAGSIAENMQASLQVPTATSVRQFPVKLLAENRTLINDHQRYSGGDKVSYTHVIAWAVVKAIMEHPNMNSTYAEEDGERFHVIPDSINLGIAIDIERRGRRTLLVPNIKNAGGMTFAQFIGIYNDLIQRARNGQLELNDFKGTTATITNPGMMGTTLSVPRLMAGQGVIVGVGSIGYPESYYAFAPEVVSRTGVSQVMTLTSTYDHRVIQGAQSGGFLSYASQLLSLGQHGFYESIFAELGIPHDPWKVAPDNTPQVGGAAADDEIEMIRKQARVLQLVRAYRVRGHLQADINPLGNAWEYHPELDPASYGLTIWDLDRRFVTGGLGGKEILPLRDILSIVRETYTGRIGIEYMHISNPTEKAWLQERMEPVRGAEPLSPDEKRHILSKMNSAEAFERFLHTKYIGHKRFSAEGSETLIPMLDAILTDSADQEVDEVVVGMAHRGRLNVLANVLHKPYEAIFGEFEGNIDPNTTQGSGDVKYHLGSHGVHSSPSGADVKVTLASNPSHLEAVDPVVEGMVRAKQTQLRRANVDAGGGDYLDAVIPVLVHGDAAFAGQGVVAETLNLSQLPGYRTGGTIHIVVNNQIGFTTTAVDARSSTYATDVARMIQAPIFHVNGDDPESCVRVARMALDYRQVFNKDVVIDMLCYRVHGHNEGDEPTYTQPLLYERIQAKRSVRLLYTEALLARGEMDPEEAEQMLQDYRARMQEAFEATKELSERDAEASVADASERTPEPVEEKPPTAVTRSAFDTAVQVLHTVPDGFNGHVKLGRQLDRRRKILEEKNTVDWGLGEALGLATLVMDGTTVRLAGQDSQRGTFSHRHAVMVDQQTGNEYIPINNIPGAEGTLDIYDSLLSEYAACGFEYGYSVADPTSLVIWEAQFGDFANGAQIIFDQFLSSAEAKWTQRSSLTLLLPHGYEGQGPEHSSARLERFLQLCGEHNMVVCNLTTPANLFHALRRQVGRSVKKPMIVMSPKSLLRHPQAVSPPEAFTDGGFQALIPDPRSGPFERHLFVSGKLYYDVMQTLASREDVADRVAVTRVEQLYPFRSDEVRAVLEAVGAEDVIWIQEEPANMGAWSFVRSRIEAVLADWRGDPCARVRYVGRPERASPSTGSARVHQIEQEALINEAISL